MNPLIFCAAFMIAGTPLQPDPKQMAGGSSPDPKEMDTKEMIDTTEIIVTDDTPPYYPPWPGIEIPEPVGHNIIPTPPINMPPPATPEPSSVVLLALAALATTIYKTINPNRKKPILFIPRMNQKGNNYERKIE